MEGYDGIWSAIPTMTGMDIQNIKIAELGHFSLIFAMFVALAQTIVPLAGATRNHPPWISFSKPTALAQFFLTAFSFGCLIYSFVISDFSMSIVYQNSHTDKPMIYKISGAWGNHEGSMLLWVLILSTFGCAIALLGKNLPPNFLARVLSVQSFVALGFYLFILFTSNPFERLIPPPINGQGLNPLLQDPGLALHPPVLYFGYVGFSIAFAFAIAALLEGRADASWGRWIRPWILSAWGFLTAGIALGSWWAYYELGWGGWWFWDPVENASLMPWLTGTALLHSAIMLEKRDTMKGWTIFLSIVTFALSLLGTFLVRSGILTSVHTFAVDSDRGVFILLILIIIIGGSLVLFAWRAPVMQNTGVFHPISREGALLLNNLIMIIACAAVLLGTLYPLFLDAMGGSKISVGPPYFNTVFIPLMVPMVLAMAVGPMLGWKRADLELVLKRLQLAIILIVIGATAIWITIKDGTFLGIIGIILATWLCLGTLIELAGRIHLFREPFHNTLTRLVRIPIASWSMTLGHLGLAITIAGMAGSSGWKQEAIQTLSPNESIDVGGYTYTFKGVEEGFGPNYSLTKGIFLVTKGGEHIVTLHPENRRYPVKSMPTTEAAIHTLFLGDLYVVLGDPEGTDGSYVTRIYWNPLVAWIWVGTFVMVLAVGIGASNRQFRVGIHSERESQMATDIKKL